MSDCIHHLVITVVCGFTGDILIFVEHLEYLLMLKASSLATKPSMKTHVDLTFLVIIFVLLGLTSSTER